MDGRCVGSHQAAFGKCSGAPKTIVHSKMEVKINKVFFFHFHFIVYSIKFVKFYIYVP
jgi:hypothetical protein